MKSQEDKLFFTNYQRLDEEVIFSEIMNILRNTPSIRIGEKNIFPSEDIYKCNILNEEFELVFDIDYGGYIRSSSKKALEKLQNILNN